MQPPQEVLETNDWWDYVKFEVDYKIQWTHHYGGWVRARLDSITPWEYRRCGNAFCACSIGEQIIYNQMDRHK